MLEEQVKGSISITETPYPSNKIPFILLCKLLILALPVMDIG